MPFWSLWTRHELPSITWRVQEERAQALLALGLDDTLMMVPAAYPEEDGMPGRYVAPGIPTRLTRQVWPSQRYPLLIKEYETPKGVLRQVVWQTEDWKEGDDVNIFSDLNMPRSQEYLASGPADLEKLAYLFPPPSAAQIESFRERARALKAVARRQGVLLECGWVAVTDALFWLCGVQPLLTAAMDDPSYVRALLRLLYDWQKPQIELALEEGAEVIVHRGWYETTRFWSPRLFRELIKPLLREEIDLVHSAGAKFRYIMSTGITPLLDEFVDLGIDAFTGVDPVQDDLDFEVVKSKLKGKMAIWGGINGTVTLGLGSPDEIREAVDRAIYTFAPGGGFALSPVDQIFDHTPWENVEIMLERWREIGRYPTRA